MPKAKKSSNKVLEGIKEQYNIFRKHLWRKPMGKVNIKKLADYIFGDYIVYSCIEDWMVECITCWRKFDYRVKEFRVRMQCGHYVSRNINRYRYSEDNCHPQCSICNVFHKGNYRNYYLYMTWRYGEEKERDMWNDKGVYKVNYYEICEKYLDKLKDLNLW